LISYLFPKDGPVISGEEGREVVYAGKQRQYLPLRTLVSDDEKGRVLSHWTLTDEQRQAIAEGADVFLNLMTFGQPLQPIQIFVACDEDTEEIKELLY
jgi:hypothetical protein